MADEITLPMKPETVITDTPEALAERAAADFAALVKETLAGQERFTVALPGGQTPKLFFTRLAQEPYRSEIEWKKIWVFWGDERCVPPDHPESNFGLAQKLLLEKVPIVNSHVFRIHGEEQPPESARVYARTLHDVFKGDPEWPTFDLMLLGMGPDGHTASLMPGTAAVQEERRWVVENVVRSLQTVRITMTLPVIDRSRNIWFLVTGAKKATVFKKVMEGPNPDVPASLVQPEHGRLVWYIDRAVVDPAFFPAR